MKMRHVFIAAVFVFLSGFGVVTAQVAEHGVIDRNTGNLLYLFQYTDIQGNPFLKNDWADAILIGKDGYVFKNQKVKFDTYNNKIVYNRNDSAFELVSDISAVNIYPNVNDTSRSIVLKKGYDINAKINAGKYLQVLAEGKIALLKYYFKELEDYNEYNNAAKLQRFKDMEQYYLFQDHKYTLITLSIKNLQAATGANWPAVQDYMKKNNLSGKTEKDWVAVVSYYNSL